MENAKIRDWEHAVDTAEQTSITANLPKIGNPGEVFIAPGDDGITREWLRVEIVSGNIGARWVYWAPWSVDGRNGVGPHPEFKAIADLIFNGEAAHFVGMLGIPYTGKIPGTNHLAWVLVSPRMTGERLQTVIEEKQRERYERSNEEFDVNTQTSKKIR